MTKCRIATDHDQGSDHLPVETTLALRTEAAQTEAQYDYTKTRWEEFDNKLTAYLQSSPVTAPLKQRIISHNSLDAYTEQLIDAITKAVQETTPHKKQCPHSKRWWNEKLTEIRREANQLRNTYRRTGHHTDKQAWRVKANEYTTESTQAKAAKWKEYVDSADAKTIWQIKKYITNVPASTLIPTLDNHAAMSEDMVTTLRKAFFPCPPSGDLTDISHSNQRATTHPPEVQYKPQVTVNQIRRAVNRLAPDKAPGPDRITNRVLKRALPIIEHHLQTAM